MFSKTDNIFDSRDDSRNNDAPRWECRALSRACLFTMVLRDGYFFGRLFFRSELPRGLALMLVGIIAVQLASSSSTFVPLHSLGLMKPLRRNQPETRTQGYGLRVHSMTTNAAPRGGGVSSYYSGKNRHSCSQANQPKTDVVVDVRCLARNDGRTGWSALPKQPWPTFSCCAKPPRMTKASLTRPSSAF